MTDEEKKTGCILRADAAAQQAFQFNHPLGGDGSQVTMSMLGRAAGLTRVGVNIGRVPPGKEAFVYHRHQAEEEWVYILEGTARSDIDGVIEDVAAGDFIAYPEGVAHNLLNTGDTDLVCLMGGENLPVEIADFPRHGKHLIRSSESMDFVDADAATPFVPDIRPVGAIK